MKADITLLLDRSGSMGSIRDATIEGINSFILKQQEEDGEAVFTLAQFDDIYEIVHDALPLQDVPFLTTETFQPRGCTALLDAMGQTINTIKTRQALLSDEEKPDKTILVIVTDGGENASNTFNREQVFEMVSGLNDVWDIIYLGANQDAIAVGAQMGVRGTSSAMYTCDTIAVSNVYSNVSRAVSSNRNSRTYAATCFTPEDRDSMVTPTSTGVDVIASADIKLGPDKD